MKTLWDPTVRRELCERLDRLSPEAERRWGSLTAPGMVAHLVDAMLMTFGELSVPSRHFPIRYPPLKQLIIYWLPFPKGAPTAPEIIGRLPADWHAECASLRTLVHRFAERDRHGSWPDHPAFGSLTGRAWGVLAYRHIDHHLRQFGV
jgi:hypothetical protein